MGAGYEVSEIIAQYEQWMGMSLFASFITELPSILVNIATYVCTALALYTIAKRRGIHRPWLAWIPIADVYLLGCIADQYRAVACRETKNRRKVLLTLRILVVVLAIATLVLCVIVILKMLSAGILHMDALDSMTESVVSALVISLVGPMMGMLLMVVPLMIVSILYAVFYYMALHDVFKSSEPSNATLYLLLSIFIGICQPVFLFICRNKDGGMPVREQPQPQPEHSFVEPWEIERE